ncbi:MAG: hypothetical protein U1F27_09520 [Turneriella sp.]
MKPKLYNRPVMVGDVRQLGGAKISPDAQQASPFSEEIDILDTPTANSADWYERQQYKFDSKLTASTLMGARDAQVTEMKVGSYVFDAVLFYFDKDWIRLSGYSVPPLFVEPERKYLLHIRPVAGRRGEKVKKEKPKKTSRRRTR